MVDLISDLELLGSAQNATGNGTGHTIQSPRLRKDKSLSHNLAMKYFTGEGIDQDNDLAVERLTKVAEQGYVDAEYNIGIMYIDRAVELNKQLSEGKGDTLLNNEMNYNLKRGLKHIEKAYKKEPDDIFFQKVLLDVYTQFKLEDKKKAMEN